MAKKQEIPKEAKKAEKALSSTKAKKAEEGTEEKSRQEKIKALMTDMLRELIAQAEMPEAESEEGIEDALERNKAAAEFAKARARQMREFEEPIHPSNLEESVKREPSSGKKEDDKELYSSKNVYGAKKPEAAGNVLMKYEISKEVEEDIGKKGHITPNAPVPDYMSKASQQELYEPPKEMFEVREPARPESEREASKKSQESIYTAKKPKRDENNIY